MQKLKNPSQPPLLHYHEAWYRVKNQPIWYLAGKDHGVDNADPNFKPGKWYFTNEADMFSAPFDTYEACKKALDSHDEYLVL